MYASEWTNKIVFEVPDFFSVYLFVFFVIKYLVVLSDFYFDF